MAPLALIGSVTRGLGGLWQYLIARSHDRTQLELEREWARSGHQILTHIPPGALFFERDGAGRYRAITMPEQRPAVESAQSGGSPEPSGQ
jgi:hypothetical protein